MKYRKAYKKMHRMPFFPLLPLLPMSIFLGSVILTVLTYRRVRSLERQLERRL
jgi:hypothetical protein